MYQEIILDHYRHPHHSGLRDPFDAEVHHVNPTCGDEVTLRIQLSGEAGEQVVEDVSYESEGCSISQASASVLADLVIGKPVGEALADRAGVQRAADLARSGRAGRGRARRRDRVRRGVEVSGAGEVRAAVLDGLEGRARSGGRV